MADKILSLIPTMQGITLLSKNIPMKKKKKKGIFGQGVENIVGLGLIKATAQSL